MLRQMANRLRGQVRVRVECLYPERVLNLCSARELAFWELAWESPTIFACTLSRRDYGRFRRAAGGVDCVVTPVGRSGAPYFLGRLRRRQVLAVGMAVCSLWVLLGSFFIWDFTVEGNETVPREEILRALEDYGVGLGTFCFSVDSADLRNHVLLEIPELSWIAVNVAGCRAYVQVRERVLPPESADRRQPTNTVARRDGLLLELHALSGVAVAQPGTTVETGQLLISGVEDTDTYGARVLGGVGEAEARTWYRLETVVPLAAVEKQYTGEERTCFSLVLGKQRIKFFPNSSIEGRRYDKITDRTQWDLFGLPLPVTAVRETCRFYEIVPAAGTPQAAEARAEAVLTEHLHHLVDPYGTVSSTLCASRQRGDALVVTLTAECRERIDRTVPIYNDTNGSEQ